MITLRDLEAYTHTKRVVTWRGRRMAVGPCPLCGGEDRFGVYEEEETGKALWFCRSCDREHPKRNTPGFWYGDFLIYLITGTRPETDWKPDPNYRRPVQSKPKVEPPKYSDLTANKPHDISLDDVVAYARNSGPTFKYFQQYKLTQRTLDHFLMGYAERIPHCSLPAGWTMPTISWGPDGVRMLRALQVRRDESACRARLLANPGWMKQRTGDLLDFWEKQITEGKRDEIHAPTIDELVEFIWPKYSYISGSQPGIWGDDLVSLPGGERIGPRLPYVFVTEDAKSAMVLRQDGYPAVAYKKRYDWNEHLGDVFQRIDAVYIVADRDEKSNNSGEGLRIAEDARKHIISARPKSVRILLPPGHHNDVADLVRDEGFDAMRAWIRAKFPGTSPVLARDEADGE